MNIRIYLCLSLILILVFGCRKLLPPAPESQSLLGEPVEGLTSDQLKNHLRGDEAFGRVFLAGDGLGPMYVATSCESCHSGDGKGHPSTMLTRFNKFDGSAYDPMIEYGGAQLQHLSIPGYTAEKIPDGVTGITKLMAPAVTGLGFLESVSDADILKLSDPNDSDGDGISGVPNYIFPPDFFFSRSHHIPNNGKYIGRFGRKAGAINLLQQVAGAYRNDMGITSDFISLDLYNVQTGELTGDDVPEPEIGSSSVHNNVFYMRTLKQPTQRNVNDPKVIKGIEIFMQIGCAKCHTPSMQTTSSDVEALSNKTFHPYTDLLLHDMGPGLDDGFSEGTAKSSEWRTTPLWGIGLSENSQGGRGFFLHDGRAKSLEEAIQFHGGEGENSRNNFNKLSEEERQNLILFLKSL